MRIAIGGIYQESHSFSPASADLETFREGVLVRGDEVFPALRGLNHEVAGALGAGEGHQMLPLAYASAGSSGQPIREEAYRYIKGAILDALADVLPVDGVYLAMHGSMLAEGEDDATGDLLAAVREAVGDETPVVASLDLHANLTRKMAGCATALVGYHTAPHIDQADTGKRGMRLLLKTLQDGVRPAMALQQIPMVLPGETGRTTDGPYHEVMDRAIQLMKQPGILDASAFYVQPWLDIPEMGCSVVVVADGDMELAQSESRSLAEAFWQRRRAFAPDLAPLDTALDTAFGSPEKPFILSDSADAPSSGAPGDSTTVLAALLDREIEEPVLLNIVDPAAVAAAFDGGVGAELDITVGGTLSKGFCEPVAFRAHVKSLSDGRFRNKGPGFHGVEFRMGRTAVLTRGGIHLVAMEQPVIQWDPELYRSQGLDPADARITVVKSPAAFRAAYEPLAAHVLILDVPGVCSPNLQTFPWQRITHPMFPFDEMGDSLPERPGAV